MPIIIHRHPAKQQVGRAATVADYFPKRKADRTTVLLLSPGEQDASNDFHEKKRKKQSVMKIDIVRTWKDEAYRASLSTEEQAMLPENPAGILELSDAELETIYGATGSSVLTLDDLSLLLCGDDGEAIHAHSRR